MLEVGKSYAFSLIQPTVDLAAGVDQADYYAMQVDEIQWPLVRCGTTIINLTSLFFIKAELVEKRRAKERSPFAPPRP